MDKNHVYMTESQWAKVDMGELDKTAIYNVVEKAEDGLIKKILYKYVWDEEKGGFVEEK